MSETFERIKQLDPEKMAGLLELFETAAKPIFNSFTVAFTGEIYGDKSVITDQMLRDLLKASNMLWFSILEAEANTIIASRSLDNGEDNK